MLETQGPLKEVPHITLSQVLVEFCTFRATPSYTVARLACPVATPLGLIRKLRLWCESDVFTVKKKMKSKHFKLFYFSINN